MSGPKGTDCVGAHRAVQPSYEKKRSIGVRPTGSAPARRGGHRPGKWCGVDTEGIERRGDVIGVVSGDEHVDVDVDGGAGSA